MAKLDLKSIKDSAIVVLQTKKQVVNFVRSYDFKKQLTIIKINNNYIIQKGSE